MRKKLTISSMMVVILLYLIPVQQAFAQNELNIHGKVTGPGGTGLAGATIKIKGSSTVSLTDENGNFSIRIPKSNTSIIISYVGYIDKEVVVRNPDQLVSVSLEPAITGLEEVVVIGYGTAKRKEVAGAVSVVNAKEAGANTSTNPSQLLIGKAAGVQVVQSNGTPGADAQIIVRGTGSFTSVDPLYVIDGIQGDKNLFNTLSSQDIENITVLKDASSTAIYGAAAANGVVIVTTKKGRSGTPRVSVLSQWGVAQAWRKLDVLNAAQYIDALKDFAATGNNTLPAKFNTQDVLVDRVDWQKEIFQKGLVSENNVNINGGSDKVVYNLSLGYITQQSTIKDLTNKRINARFSLEETLGRFKFGQTLNIRQTTTTGLLTNVISAIGYAPYKPVYDESVLGGYSIVTNVDDFSNVNNPLQEINVKTQKNKEYLFFPQLYGEVNLIKGLKFRSQLSATIGGGRNVGYQYPYTASNNLGFSRQATQSYNDYSYYTFENYFSYDKKFGLHTISATLGNSYLSSGNTASLSGLGSNIPNDNIQNISVASTQTVNGSSYNYARPSVISYFARINYSFDDKYILTASFRRDGASNFGANNRFGNFPGAGLAWRFSNEDFINTALPFLSEGKIRVGWGRTGNNNIPNFLTSPLTFAGNPTGNLVYSFGTNEAFVPGTTVSTLANPDLRWEQTDQTDVGLDLGFLNNKLNITVDWYKRKSSGLLVSVPIPSSSGIGLSGVQSSKTVNAADAQNTGIEFQVGYADKTSKDFSYNVSINAAFNKNEVLSLGSEFAAPIQAGAFDQLSAFTYTAAGSAIGAFYGYRLDKVASTQAEIDALNAKTGTPATEYQEGLKPGDFIFKDLDGDNKVTSADQEILGNPIPKVVYGFNAGVSFKNFDLNIVFSGVSGLKLLNATRFNTLIMATGHNATTAILDRWRQSGDVASLPRLGQNANSSGNLRASDWWLEDGSYARLRNLTIGYTFNQEKLSGFINGSFKNIRVYVAAQNLFTITKYTGYDPEVMVQSGQSFIFNRGIDDGQIPQPRTFLAGIQLGF
ncbi:MAG: TonB-dependent receptor [Agriterribacter sp.]